MVHSVNLHESPDVFVELIQATAAHHVIPEVYVEKDYWVTKALKRLSESNFADQIVFKGGTSLSKAHRLIRRFSEDIDLAAKCCGVSGNKTKALLKNAERAMTVDLEYQQNHARESKGTKFRKTVHAYPTAVEGSEFGVVSDAIFLELNAFTVPEPSEPLPISSLIQDLLTAESRADLVNEHGLGAFQIEVLRVERTLCEKVMGLVRASYEDDSEAALRRQIRHIYDLCMILREPTYRDFLAADDFIQMMDTVRAADRSLFEGAERWLEKPAREAVLLADPDTIWSSLRTEFQGDFRQMLYDDELPDDKEVLEMLGSLRVRL